MDKLLLVWLVIDLFMFTAGLLLIVAPNVVDRIFGWPLRMLRRKKADIPQRPEPRWRSILVKAFGLLLVLFVVDDLRGLEIIKLADTVPVVQSGSSLEPGLQKEVDSIVRPLITSGQYVGITIGIIDGDKKWTCGYGRKDTKSNRPPNGTTVYEIGSITKTFTGSCFARMCVDGELNPNIPVQQLLPASVHMPEYKSRVITLGDLVDHTSGLPRIPSNMPLLSLAGNPYASYGDAKLYEFLNGYKLTRSPGEQYDYSNLGMGLLGLALSKKQGMSYEQMVLKNVCKPLGMHDTVITLSDDQQRRLAHGYVSQTRIGKSLAAVPADNWTFQDSTAGAGAIRSTADDMLKYISANIGLVKTPLQSAFDLAHKPRHKIADDFQIGMAWHMFEMGKKNDLVHWHNGQTEGYQSFIGFSRKRKIGVIVLSNSTSSEEEIDKTGLKIIKYMLGRS